MKRHSIPSMREAGVNVTPLIDIVMVLIVFFMLVAKIGVSRGEDTSIQLPSAILGKNLDSLSETLTLNVRWNKNGDEPILDALIGDTKLELHITRQASRGKDDSLAQNLTIWRSTLKDKANLIIRADQDMPYRQLEQVLLAAAQAEVANISYETRLAQRPPAQ